MILREAIFCAATKSLASSPGPELVRNQCPVAAPFVNEDFRASLKRRASQREISRCDPLELRLFLRTRCLLRRSIVRARGIARSPFSLTRVTIIIGNL